MATARGLESQRWTEEEEMILVSAWINVGNDSINGNSQKDRVLWAKIAAYYQNVGTGRHREVDALRKKWDNLKRDIGKFAGCYERIKSKGGSGFNEYDFRQQAMQLFKHENKKEFAHFRSWEILRNEPKFKEICKLGSKKSGKRPCDSITEATEDMTGVDETPPEVRPLGQKAAKRRQREKDLPASGFEKKKELFEKYLDRISTVAKNIEVQSNALLQFNQLYTIQLKHKYLTINRNALTPQQRLVYDQTFQDLQNVSSGVNMDPPMAAGTSENDLDATLNPMDLTDDEEGCNW